jgi:hypothetical protein
MIFSTHQTVAFVSHDKRQQGTKTRRSSEVYIEAIAAFYLLHLLPDLQWRGTIGEGMKWLIMAVGLISLFACQALAGEHAALARVTVYWPGEGSGANAAWNGARLSEGHCAVNPKKIPYGSKVVFLDAESLAVDTGPDVVNRKAARLSGRNQSERNAIVIDRFFDAKEKALAWANANPHFMVVRVRTADTEAPH